MSTSSYFISPSFLASGSGFTTLQHYNFTTSIKRIKTPEYLLTHLFPATITFYPAHGQGTTPPLKPTLDTGNIGMMPSLTPSYPSPLRIVYMISIDSRLTISRLTALTRQRFLKLISSQMVVKLASILVQALLSIYHR